MDEYIPRINESSQEPRINKTEKVDSTKKKKKKINSNKKILLIEAPL